MPQSPARSPASRKPPRPVGQSASQPSLPTSVQRNRLTPRSAEACRRTGIEPSELLPLPREAFREEGQPPEVEQKKWELYEQMRVDAYQTVRAERDRILGEQGDKPFVADATDVGKAAPGSPSVVDAEARAAEIQSEAMEQRAIEKIKKKQQAEIEQMLMFEIRSAQLAEEKRQKVEALAAADARDKAERDARAAAAAEQRLQHELEKRDAEAAAEREARRRQQAEMARDAKRRAMDDEAERQRLLELDRREKERAAKQQARRDRQQSLLAKQQEEAYARQAQERQREDERIQRLEEKRQADADAAAAVRERAERRIALTMQMKEERSDQLRSNYIKKLASEERRRAEWNAAKQEQIDARVRAGEEKQVRLLRLACLSRTDVLRRACPSLPVLARPCPSLPVLAHARPGSCPSHGFSRVPASPPCVPVAHPRGPEYDGADD